MLLVGFSVCARVSGSGASALTLFTLRLVASGVTSSFFTARCYPGHVSGQNDLTSFR